MYTVSPGTLTTIAALFGLIFYAIMPTTLSFGHLHILAVVVTYTNALLASLNGRRNLRSGMAASHIAALSSIRVANGPNTIRIGQPVDEPDDSTIIGGSYTASNKEYPMEAV
ncbi:hypothetical protein BU17DRAFT_88036 [Hysterangium stoloniferum]|nr:hypothetical protein BU17DRAFT_88036 [Hysterangium stoloniferum]